MARDEAVAGALGSSVTLAIAALDLLSRERSGVFTGLVAIGPFVTAVLAGPVVTAGVAVSAVVLALGLGVANGVFDTFANGLEVTVVTVAGGLAVGLAWQRTQAQRSLTAMRDVAAAVQEAIITPVPATLSGLAWAARYESATAEALLGGDFYEVVDSPFGVRAIIGDVCGKGLPAACLAAKAVGSFATVAQLESGLLGLVKAMETSLASLMDDEEFITAAVVEFCGDGSVSVVNCGHHPPLRVADGEVQLLACARETCRWASATNRHSGASTSRRAPGCCSTPTGSWKPVTAAGRCSCSPKPAGTRSRPPGRARVRDPAGGRRRAPALRAQRHRWRPPRRHRPPPRRTAGRRY